MPRRLPPFAALRAFEAAAMHNNFKKAAEDIHLSASAVSHQVRSLEEYLGVQLFSRESGKPRLTNAGAIYLEDIQLIFDKLEIATKSISERSKRQSLVVNLFHSLASCWLIPHLSVFQKEHPEVDIKLLSSYEPVEFTASDIDIAIRYGEGNWVGLKSDFLFHDELTLVCSPELAEKLPPLDQASQLKAFTQIRCDLDPSEWKSWFNQAKVDMPEFQNSLELDSRAQVLEAAAGGLGIAIGRMPYVHEDLKNGRLCTPYALKFRCQQRYYLVYPEHHSNYTSVACFREWLLQECSKLQEY